jgi:NADH-ubiquinone oxidoreductase chain 2
LIAIGFNLYNPYFKIHKEKFEELTDQINSPIQLISQLKGYFYKNPVLSLSLVITIFSFVGIPPLIGFFAKQMVLSAALNNGYIFLSLIAILTSIISGVYYLNLVKEIFFFVPSENNFFEKKIKSRNLFLEIKNDYFDKIKISSNISITISIITLIILLFIFLNKE